MKGINFTKSGDIYNQVWLLSRLKFDQMSKIEKNDDGGGRASDDDDDVA